MTEEQIKQKFKETYPDFMRGDEPLSPYFDIWEYAIEIATKTIVVEHFEAYGQCRDSRRIADLENKLANVSYQLEGRDNEIAELKEERGNYKAMYLKEILKKNKAKELLKWFVWYFKEGSPNLVSYKHKVEEAEQFISEVEK